jgi:hypothetical protein
MTEPSADAEPNRDSPEPTKPPDESDDSAESKPTSRRRSRRAIAIIAAAVALVVVAAGLLGARVLGVWGTDADPSAAPTPTPSPAESAAPSPFDRTPAEEFPEGADGIVLPEAEAVGDFTAEQVAEALEQVRDALIAARLDRSTLIDHDTEPFLSLLIADQQPGLREAVDSAEFGAFPTQIAADASPASALPRVQGSFSYEATDAGPDRPLLEVVTRFAWVYAFDATDRGSGSGYRLVVVRDELVWQVRDEPWIESSRGLSLYTVAVQAWGVDCDAYDDGLLSPADGPATELDEGSDVIFDPEGPLDSADTC